MVSHANVFDQRRPVLTLMPVGQAPDLSGQSALSSSERVITGIDATCADIERLVAGLRTHGVAFPALCRNALNTLLDRTDDLCTLVHASQYEESTVTFVYQTFEAAHFAAQEQFSEYVRWLLDYADSLEEQLTRVRPRAARRLRQRIASLRPLVPVPDAIADLSHTFSLASRLNAIIRPAEIILIERGVL